MTERRKRHRNKKDDSRQAAPAAPVIIARREDPRGARVQPRILLKKDAPETGTSVNAASQTSSQNPSRFPRTVIITRNDGRNSSERNATVSAATASTSSNNTSRDKTDAATTPVVDGPLCMNRSKALFGLIHPNTRKFFHKSNSDFTVIGVLGAQSVGKSTLLNILAVDQECDYDYYKHLFGPNAEDCIFNTRPKPKVQGQLHRNVLRPNTDAAQFFITKERYILIDTPPLLSSITAREADFLDTNQSIGIIIQMLDFCHILLLVVNDLNLEQLRLLHLALHLRSRNLGKQYISDYMPQVIFVRTHCKRQDYDPLVRERFDKKLAQLYSSTGLRIYRARGESRCVNSLMIPEVKSGAATTYHASLDDIIRKFRERVLSTNRSHMCSSNTFNESQWFDMFCESIRKGTQHFENIYADLKKRHFEAGPKRGLGADGLCDGRKNNK